MPLLCPYCAFLGLRAFHLALFKKIILENNENVQTKGNTTTKKDITVSTVNLFHLCFDILTHIIVIILF